MIWHFASIRNLAMVIMTAVLRKTCSSYAKWNDGSFQYGETQAIDKCSTAIISNCDHYVIFLVNLKFSKATWKQFSTRKPCRNMCIRRFYITRLAPPLDKRRSYNCQIQQFSTYVKTWVNTDYTRIERLSLVKAPSQCSDSSTISASVLRQKGS